MAPTPAPPSGTTAALPLASRVKSHVAAVLASPLAGRAVGLAFRDRVPSAVGRVDTASPAVPPEVKARLAFRLYERAELRYVAGVLRTDLPVVELGASLGVITRAIAARVDPAQPILAVEANPDLIAPLRRNLVLAGIADRVTVVHAAVTSHATPDGTVALAFGPTSTDARVSHDGHGRHDNGQGLVAVPAMTLTQLLADHDIDGRYALVCDIEGAEADLLRHEPAALARCAQAVVETHDTDLDGEPIGWADVIEQLVDATGMTLVAQHGPVVVLGRETG